MSLFICPLCRAPLQADAKVWRCAQGHSFDVAREGYVNLLPVQHKHSRAPGDNADMVTARREFLQAGHYQPLREAAVALLAPLQAQSLLDLGCGEGYYSSAFRAAVPNVIGLDIAKSAVRLAAKRFRDIIWLVGSGALLPLADASVDVVSSLFSPLPIAEMRRVLKPAGRVLVVTPAAGHLLSIRERLFDEVRAHEPDKFLAAFESEFDLQQRQHLQFPLRLTPPALKQLLLMTPYAWKAKPERRAALEAGEGAVTEAAFTLLLFRRKASG
ncbi:MAG: methyltransferase protein [Nevskia sp.]|nr:methyltransferase protein [Nevskia sp.]